MRRILFLFTLSLTLWSCKDRQPEPAAPPANRSVLIYSNSFPGTFEVTDYDANGLPTMAKTSIYHNMDVAPEGTYTSSIKLEYDAQARVKKTVQVYDQRGMASCCPGYVVYEPDQQIVNEYEYLGNTGKITHEISYSVNAKKAEKKIISEFGRRFNEQGLLLEEKKGNQITYKATYDANGNVLDESLPSAEKPVRRQWDYVFDANKRVVSRRIVGSAGFENNTYDEQGRLSRQVTNLSFILPFKPRSEEMGKLINYNFAKRAEQQDLLFTYFDNGVFWNERPRVVTYEYVGEETLITATIYQLWDINWNQISQPTFDLTLLPNEKLASIQQIKWRLNKWNKLTSEEFSHKYVSDKLAAEQRGTYYAYDNAYNYDELGNLVGSSGHTTIFNMTRQANVNTFVARYKNL
ncbi:hypothetical protein M0L20_17050 [Spirosoma sp. RP8]|uniref:DUF4595 domain-containing protein n=1 Tax=Spirosoma liriopis TaxID=2937440 RepID=A0ABT0HN36_9BACT|nr:hypothetical protein [Spirosoma liriopis]MCK8493576.1 hypothetical protein [Spirosoma liriopis]